MAYIHSFKKKEVEMCFKDGGDSIIVEQIYYVYSSN